jgi:hypothetical protein
LFLLRIRRALWAVEDVWSTIKVCKRKREREREKEKERETHREREREELVLARVFLSCSALFLTSPSALAHQAENVVPRRDTFLGDDEDFRVERERYRDGFDRFRQVLHQYSMSFSEKKEMCRFCSRRRRKTKLSS